MMLRMKLVRRYRQLNIVKKLVESRTTRKSKALVEAVILVPSDLNIVKELVGVADDDAKNEAFEEAVKEQNT